MNEFEKCWLNYNRADIVPEYIKQIDTVICESNSHIAENAVNEVCIAMKDIYGIEINRASSDKTNGSIILKIFDENDQKYAGTFTPDKEGYVIYFVKENNNIIVASASDAGVLYGVFRLFRELIIHGMSEDMLICENPQIPFRMINHWDNMAGDIERGYSGNSFFYDDYKIIIDDRTKMYARLMSSVGINAITINNVNVHKIETELITDTYLSEVKQISDIFNSYGIKLYLSINFAAPMELSDIDNCDPLNEDVVAWWEKATAHIYEIIPNFGGFLVKADSEGRPGPFTYGRTHAEGANMLARVIKPYGGIVVWRCFVYNCRQDWRDRKTDRARAGYDNFAGLDGQFEDNVILQIKNGPMDFQIREPVSPLFGGLKATNIFLEFQIAQEYTGQQIDICYLVPMWKEVLDFNTYATETATVKNIVSGKEYGNAVCGIAGVTNTGNDSNWTGHDFSAANLYGFARLCFNPELSSEEIAKEWAAITYKDDLVRKNVYEIIIDSRSTYEKYTSPLGIGWMVNPNSHYGPFVDGYEYDRWGTYHRADRNGIGQDRTVKYGTGYTAQYNEPWATRYENVETTPEELLLFFHYTKYDYVLSTGKTLIQHIYDTHFEGVDEINVMIDKWKEVKGLVDDKIYERVYERMNRQLYNATEWCDRVNTYFYRMSGISDEKGRTIY
ncbi:MAG: alpha-glucuronidase [Lachnospiraceae bacterium]|nr:alpha-glucuronidase [Lachnospiraceae bacterium]